jgi:hypothetical protein
MTEPPPLPPVLTGQDQRELVEALLHTFPSPDDLKQFVRFGLDENLDAIAGNAGLRTVIFELIRHTESHGTTRELLSAAIAERPGNPKLRAFMQKRGLPVPALEEPLPGPGPTPAWTRALLVAAAILAMLGLGWVFREKLLPPEPPRPAPSATISATPALTPFAQGTRGIVLAGPWKESDPDPPLHGQLDKLDAQHALQRVPFWSRASHAELRRRATAAGAVLLVEVGQNGKAQVFPLGELEKNALFQGPIDVDPLRDGAALVINGLARSGGPRPEMQLDTAPCPTLDPERLDRFALLALLVVPRCQLQAIDTRAFRGVCGPSPNYADETCALALYLDAEHNADDDPETARDNLRNLLKSGPPPFESVVKLSLASLDCRYKATLDSATQTLLALAASNEPCLSAQLPALASCIRTTSTPAPDLPHDDETTRTQTKLREIEGRQIDPEQQCPAQQRARAMARRAYYHRARQDQWEAATDEYWEAFKLGKDPAYALSLAELWLTQQQPDKAKTALAPLRAMKLKDRNEEIRAALLRWITARQAKDTLARSEAEDLLRKLFAERPEAGAPASRPDEDLRKLACGMPAKTPCVYDVLRSASSSVETLNASLRVP